MEYFASPKKTIAAALLALAAIAFSLPAVADGAANHLYLSTDFGGMLTVACSDGSSYQLDSHFAGTPLIFDARIPNASQTASYTAPEFVGYTFKGWYRAAPRTPVNSTPAYYTSFPTTIATYSTCVQTSRTFIPVQSYLGTTCKLESNGTYSGLTALYMAKYEQATYRVDFANNGQGVSTLPESKTATGGETISLPKLTDSSNGYLFEDWCEDAALTKPVKLDAQGKYQPRSSLTLYAAWTPKSFQVSFYTIEGTVKPDSKTVTYGGTYGDLPTPTRAGYRFLGWSLNGNRITAETEVTTAANVTLTADWDKIDYRIAIHSNFKGRYEEKEGSIAFIPDYTTVTIETASTYKFTAPGLRFLGWDFDPDAVDPQYDTTFKEIGETFANQLKDNETVVNLYAIWKVLTYTVRFEAPDATSGTMEDQVIERDRTVALSTNAFVRTGWRFDQWYDGTTYYADGELVCDLATADETITLTATWAPISYTIKFDGNCPAVGSLLTDPPGSMTLAYNARKSLPKWYPENSIAEFQGWALKPDATSVEFVNGATVGGLAAEDGAVVTLYAVWDYYDMTLSEAVGCNNLAFTTDEPIVGSLLLTGWSAIGAPGEGLASGMAKRSSGAEVLGTPSELHIKSLTGPGTLVFIWEQDEKAGYKACFEYGETAANKRITATVGLKTERVKFESEGGHEAVWKAWGEAGNARIYSIRWIPEGVSPEPTEEDRPVIGSDFTFETSPDFDYVIWTTTDLTVAPDKWERYGDVITGNGDPVQLPIPPLGDAAGEGVSRYGCKFFKVEVIQRGSK